MARSVRKFKETIEIRKGLLQRFRSHRFFSIGLVAITLLLAACLHIWQRVMVIELAKDVALLTDENRLLVDEIKKVRSDVVALSTVTRLENYAADSLKLQPPTADRLFTLVSKSEGAISSSELQEMFSSIKRVADYLPVMTEAQATAGRELRPIKFDTLAGEEIIR
jgi:hypothetical protein